MAVLDDMDTKLDVLLDIMREEVNLLPDMVNPNFSIAQFQLNTMNMSIPLPGRLDVIDADGCRWLRLVLRGPMNDVIINHRWRCVYRDPLSGTTIDKPGHYGQ